MRKTTILILGLAASTTLMAENQYGQLPVTAELCVTVSNAMGIDLGSGVDVAIHGKAGGGLRKAADVYAAFEMDLSGSFSAAASVGGSADTETCVDMVDVDEASLSAADLEIYNVLRRQFSLSPEPLDFNEMGTNVIRNSTALSVSQTQANASINVISAQFDFIDSFLFDPINPINQVNQMIQIADHASAILPPRLARGLREIDQVVIRHLGNIDLINRSCADLTNGRIEHLGDEVNTKLQEFCDIAILFRSDTIAELQNLVSLLSSNRGVASNLTRIVGEVNKLQTLGNGISSAVGDVVDFGDQVVSQLLGTIDTITNVGINIEGAINVAEQTVDSSLTGVVTATNVISSASGGILTATQAAQGFLQTTVRPAVQTAKDLTINLPSIVQNEIDTTLCEFQIIHDTGIPLITGGNIVITLPRLGSLPIINGTLCR